MFSIFFISFFEKLDPFEKISDLQKEIIKLRERLETKEKESQGKVNCKNETLREILTMCAGLQGNDIFLHWQQTES